MVFYASYWFGLPESCHYVIWDKMFSTATMAFKLSLFRCSLSHSAVINLNRMMIFACGNSCFFPPPLISMSPMLATGMAYWQQLFVFIKSKCSFYSHHQSFFSSKLSLKIRGCHFTFIPFLTFSNTSGYRYLNQVMDLSQPGQIVPLGIEALVGVRGTSKPSEFPSVKSQFVHKLYVHTSKQLNLFGFISCCCLHMISIFSYDFCKVRTNTSKLICRMLNAH